MSPISVRVVGGPLDGGVYELHGEPGSLIDLSTAAGVCTYEFAVSDKDERILKYLGPASAANGSGSGSPARPPSK